MRVWWLVWRWVFGLAGVVFLVGLFPVVVYAGCGFILQLFLVPAHQGSGTSACFGRASFEEEYIFMWQVCGRVGGIPSSLKHNPDAAEYEDAH